MQVLNKKKILAAVKILIILVVSAVVLVMIVIPAFSPGTGPGRQGELLRDIRQNASRAREAAHLLLEEKYRINGYPETGEIIITQAEIEEFLGREHDENIAIIAKSAQRNLKSSDIEITTFFYVNFGEKMVLFLDDDELIEYKSHN